MNICVFCSSSNAIGSEYFKLAKELGSLIGQNHHNLVYGGANVGSMNELAKSVQENGGRVTAIMPEFIEIKGLLYNNADEIIITKDMRERKKTMENLSDAFIALPGGFGTIEEILEILALKQLQVHNKSVILINYKNHYDSLIELFEQFYSKKFAKPENRNYYHFCKTAEEAIKYCENYKPVSFIDKWFRVQTEENK